MNNVAMWAAIRKNFQRGILNWQEAKKRLEEEGATFGEIEGLIGTEEEYKKSLAEAGIK